MAGVVVVVARGTRISYGKSIKHFFLYQYFYFLYFIDFVQGCIEEVVILWKVMRD